MSNMQRVAGPLFAKVRNVQNKFVALEERWQITTAQLARVQIDLDYANRKLDEERKLTRMSFALVVGLLGGIQFSILYMAWNGQYSACFVPPDRNATDDGHHETDVAHFLARIIADECFVWFFHE